MQFRIRMLETIDRREYCGDDIPNVENDDLILEKGSVYDAKYQVSLTDKGHGLLKDTQCVYIECFVVEISEGFGLQVDIEKAEIVKED